MDSRGSAYVGNVEYSRSRNNDGISFWSRVDKVHNPEGYATTLFSSSYVSTFFMYYRKDHLGNNREVWQAPYIIYVNNNMVSPAYTAQRTQYYPSGLPWAEGEDARLQNRKYNGKEWIEAHGYDEYDYGARGMYPAIARFTTVDPLAEKYYWISPYAYCLNNPVKYIDPDGMKVSLTGYELLQIIDELAKTTNVNLHWDKDNGYLTYEKSDKVEYNEYDKEIMKAIDDPNIEVRLRGLTQEQSYSNKTIDYYKITPEGSVIGGAFEGSRVFSNRKVVATQSIDYTTIKNMEKVGMDKSGFVIGHELLEAYYGAQDYPGTTINGSEAAKKAYTESHNKALKVLPLMLYRTYLLPDGTIQVSLNGLAPVTVRPPKKK